MKTILLTVAFLGLSSSVFADQGKYDDCLLKHLKNAKLDIAAHTIRMACDENYRNSSFTSKERRAFNECLLKHLPGVESVQAVIGLKSACQSKYQ